MIVDASEKSRGNHPGIIEYKGKSYCFGHASDIIKRQTTKFYERRSVDIDEMVYNADGTIQNRHYWSVEGPAQLGAYNPYRRVEAETMAWSEGVKTRFEEEYERNFTWDRGKKLAERLFVTSIHHGDYIMVQGVDFGNGPKSVEVSVASMYGGKIEFRTGKIDGPLLATVDVKSEGDAGVWKTLSVATNKTKGKHDLYIVFKGEKELFDFDWWHFKQ